MKHILVISALRSKKDHWRSKFRSRHQSLFFLKQRKSGKIGSEKKLFLSLVPEPEMGWWERLSGERQVSYIDSSKVKGQSQPLALHFETPG